MSSGDENSDDFVTAPSPTKRQTKYPAVNNPKFASSVKDPFSNLASSSSRAHAGPSFLSRAATDGELLSATASELQKTISYQHQLLEAKDKQLLAKHKRLEAKENQLLAEKKSLEAARSEIQALAEELEAIQAEHRIREKFNMPMMTTTTTTPSSTTKTVIIQVFPIYFFGIVRMY
jgi:septal ring factor EnvC (AmiA/AmiB activator)